MIVGPIQFERPVWLLMAPVCWLLVWALSRRSLSGLSRATRVAAIVVRCLVLAVLAAALAEPSLRRVARSVAVLLVVDKSQSMPPATGKTLGALMTEAVKAARPEDRLGVVTAAEQGRAQEIPSASVKPELLVSERIAKGDDWDPGPREATNLAEGVRLALAIKPEDAAARIVLVSDGNENRGSVIDAAQASKATGIPIDVLPIPYDIRGEVMTDQLVAPATARKGQTVDLRVVLTATRRATGSLGLLVNGRPYDLKPGRPGDLEQVTLEPGNNVLRIPVELTEGGPQQFEAVFTPDTPDDDRYIQNNRASAVTFVSTEGRVLLLSDDRRAAEPIAYALDSARIGAELRSPTQAPQSLVDLQRYDALILIDTPASAFSARQLQEFVSFVRDSGGGLVMVGGPNSFGAGGWIGTTLADALPVKLDPPQKRQIPRGAMALIMHSCEMPQGNYWGQKTAEAAVGALSRLDLVGVLEAQMAGQGWVYPLSPKGDGVDLAKAIQNLRFSDMFDYSPVLQASLTALQQAKAGFKHVLVISDGDPQGPSPALLAQFVQSKITISCVEVFPHGGNFSGTMAQMAKATGGNHYTINQLGQVAQLPQIFIKEAQMVRRTLIWEGEPIRPSVTGTTETMRGLGAMLPPVTGYVVTADREGLSQITSRAPGENPDPITAQWQFGLGRSVAVTTDAASRWSPAWLTWDRFRAFWEQHVRWVMRPSGSSNVSVATQSEDDHTRVIATMLDSSGEPLNFARLTARAVSPDLQPIEFEMRQTGPGRYEGRFPAAESGSYLVNLRYDAPRGDGGGVESGSVQAAVTRRGADEYRALRDNSPLLAQVAEVTGGRVLSAGAARAGLGTDDLFTRDALTMPVALRPAWIASALIAMMLFLLDVAVRRVRVDIPAIARALRRGAQRGAEARAVEGGALLKARRQAQARMDAARAADAASRASTKFDAPAGTPSGPVISQPRAPVTHKPAEPPGTSQTQDDQEGMSRLLRAKRKAREGMDSDDHPG